jgi:hypothetical protein
VNPEDPPQPATNGSGGRGDRTIRFTDHAQKELAIARLEMPEVGHVFNAEDEFGTVESVKAVSALHAGLARSKVNKGAIQEPASSTTIRSVTAGSSRSSLTDEEACSCPPSSTPST